ncbi:unnamed protein product [Allacma fusca]|uniref:Uncharacterized protein n=1 Tax=Allacma fusca TaxID=39272 RepID=A0A8J2NSX9_9HEXA|nr:unnamed protein product [Allacma fusca]
MKFIILLLICMLPEQAPGQVCSPPGQLCARSTDCCRGCCEQYTCVERELKTILIQRLALDEHGRSYAALTK